MVCYDFMTSSIRYLFLHISRKVVIHLCDKGCGNVWFAIDIFSFFYLAPIAPPPSELPRGDADSSSRRGNASVPNIDDVTAREAVLSYASQYFCWGLGVAREMTIMDITASSAFHVKIIVIITSRGK